MRFEEVGSEGRGKEGGSSRSLNRLHNSKPTYRDNPTQTTPWTRMQMRIQRRRDRPNGRFSKMWRTLPTLLSLVSCPRALKRIDSEMECGCMMFD